MQVSDHYGITGDVPFLNVHVDRDNLLFLDPSAIRNARNDPLAARAHGLLLDFFGEVLRCRRSGSTADQDKGLRLLRRLHEPNETRLGMCIGPVAGHAFGDELGERLWDDLGSNSAARTAVLNRLEDLPLFVDGVGPDLVSDLSTRVIFEVLADFTHRMTVRYPQLAAGQTTTTVELWDGTFRIWRPRPLTLPYVDPHPLLLVPKPWVYWRNLMNPMAFYNRYGTQTVQRERTVHTPNGRRLAPSKARIRREFPHVRRLNIQQAVKYREHGEDLVAAYREWVDSEFAPLSDDELQRRLQ